MNSTNSNNFYVFLELLQAIIKIYKKYTLIVLS